MFSSESHVCLAVVIPRATACFSFLPSSLPLDNRPHTPQAFSETDEEVSRVVVIASLIMALVLLVLGCVTACIARVVAQGIVQPVNQLIDVVHALNKLDFSRQVRKRYVGGDKDPRIVLRVTST